MKVTPDPVGRGQESVWSYPWPAIAEPSQRRLKIVHRDIVIDLRVIHRGGPVVKLKWETTGTPFLCRRN